MTRLRQGATPGAARLRKSPGAARIGKHQLRTLVMLGSPTMLLLTPGRPERAMVARGLLREDRPGVLAIAPAGLRVLADEMEAGRVDIALAEIRKDAEERRARAQQRGSRLASPRVRGEADPAKRSEAGAGEGDSRRARSSESPPHPDRCAIRPLPASGER